MEKAKKFATGQVKSGINDMGYGTANDMINEQILGKGYVSSVGNVVVPDAAKSSYYCPECGEQKWVLKAVPWRGACESCLSKKDILGKKLAAMEGIGNYITPEVARNYYNCPTCSKTVYVVAGTPYQGECQLCLSKRDTSGKGLKVMEGVGNKITKESMRSYYNCPDCNKKVYVVKGAPYRGACVNCMNKKNVFEKAGSGITGVFKGVGSWF